MKEIDEWIELAVPIGSKTGQGLRAMQIPTMHSPRRMGEIVRSR